MCLPELSDLELLSKNSEKIRLLLIAVSALCLAACGRPSRLGASGLQAFPQRIVRMMPPKLRIEQHG